jgi:predicted nuclease of restriction endonuclease-like (RecB) superfamily
MSKSKALSLPDYPAFLAALKARILDARTSAARAVNRDLILLYWDIGRGIVEKQRTAGWGDSVVECLAADLRAAFPDMRGFSADNLWRMRQFYSEYSSGEFLEQAVPETDPNARASPPTRSGILSHSVRDLATAIPWGHHVELLKKVKDPAARHYYLHATAQFGWSRNVLLNQIKGGAYERAVKEKKTHNFDLALPERLAEQADEMLKSRYNLEFLGIARSVKEREIEDRLVSHLRRFILELVYGFCFIGSQYRLAIGSKELLS